MSARRGRAGRRVDRGEPPAPARRSIQAIDDARFEARMTQRSHGAPRRALAALLAAGAVLTPLTARAAEDFVDQTDKDGQRVVFKDDPMTADTMGSTGAVLVLRPSAARVGLLRPRVEFIREMLKSVENL